MTDPGNIPSLVELLRRAANDGSREVNWREYFRQIAMVLDASETLQVMLTRHSDSLFKTLVVFGLMLLGMIGINFYLWAQLTECGSRLTN